jgi:MFS family permease
MSRIDYFLKTPNGRTFSLVWIGQFISTIGSSMTRFGLAIWVFTETGSTMQLSIVVLAGTLPALVMSPFVGALVDRWDRRVAMIVADSGAALGTLFIAVLVGTGSLEMWHLYLALAFSSVFGSFQFPAYSAATTLLVPKDQYARAAGMVQLAGSIGRVGAPALAGVMVVSYGLMPLFVIDFVTFAIAVGTLLFVAFPNPDSPPKGAITPGSLFREAKEGFRFVSARSGLRVLLLTFSVVNFAFSFQGVLLIPLLLTLSSEAVTGIVVSISALGLVVGSLLMSFWGGSPNRIRDLYVALGVMGVGLTLVGLRPWVLLVLLAITVTHLALPVASSSSQALWQAKVPPEIQGRVFAVRQMFAIGATPLAFLLAGFLAEKVFEPMFVAGRSGGLSWIVGAGDGRGIGLLLVIMGVTVTIVAYASWRSHAIQNLDQEVPDIAARASESAGT